MKKSFKLENLDCAHCAAKMEEKINKIEGVSAQITYMTSLLSIEADDEVFEQKVDLAQKAIRSIERDCKIMR